MKFLIVIVFCIACSSALRIYVRPDFGPNRPIIGSKKFFPNRPSFGNFGVHRPIISPNFPPSQNKPCGGQSMTVSPIQSAPAEIFTDSTSNELESSSIAPTMIFESSTGPVEVTTNSFDSSTVSNDQGSSTSAVFESSSSSNFAEQTTNAFSESSVNPNDQETSSASVVDSSSSNSNSADETTNAVSVTSEDVTSAQSTMLPTTVNEESSPVSVNSEINTTTFTPTVPPTKKGWFKWIKDKITDVFG